MGRLLLPKPFLRPKREKDLTFTFLGRGWGIIYEKGIISTVVGRESSWSAEYVAGQKAGLQDRKGCLCEEMDHTPLLCLLQRIKKLQQGVSSR